MDIKEMLSRYIGGGVSDSIALRCWPDAWLTSGAARMRCPAVRCTCCIHRSKNECFGPPA
eukprot:2761191-Amphidinium_carterae.1